jgi:hypothetical protein
LRANPCRIEKKPEDFRVRARRPAREEIQREKHTGGSRQAAEEVENAGRHNQRKEKQFALDTEDRERAIQ